MAAIDRALVIQHEAAAPAGLLAEWARTRGIALTVVRPDLGQALPDPSGGLAFAVLLGAAASVTDPGVRWLADELDWIRRADACGLALLGICFGAQALAAALGGHVRRATAPELDWIEVELSPTLPDDGASLARGPWLAWHQDVIDLPARATPLATNRAGVQAFLLGPHLGVQFHPEVTAEIVRRWIDDARSDFPGVHIDGDALRRCSAEQAQRAAPNASRLFELFLRHAVSRAQA